MPRQFIIKTVGVSVASAIEKLLAFSVTPIPSKYPITPSITAIPSPVFSASKYFNLSLLQKKLSKFPDGTPNTLWWNIGSI